MHHHLVTPDLDLVHLVGHDRDDFRQGVALVELDLVEAFDDVEKLAGDLDDVLLLLALVLVVDVVLENVGGLDAGEIVVLKPIRRKADPEPAGFAQHDRCHLLQALFEEEQRGLAVLLKIGTVGQVVKAKAIGDVLLKIGGQRDVSHGRGQFPVEIPVLVVLGAVIIEEILQQRGCGRQSRIEFLAEVRLGGVLHLADVEAAFQVIVREDADLAREADVGRRARWLASGWARVHRSSRWAVLCGWVQQRCGSRSEQLVSRILFPLGVTPSRAAIIPLECRLPGISCDLPGGSGGQPSNAPLFGLAPGGVCRAPRSPGGLVRSYRTFSPLPLVAVVQTALRGGILSVALSFVSPRLHVMEHPALRCSDFPPAHEGPAIA